MSLRREIRLVHTRRISTKNVKITSITSSSLMVVSFVRCLMTRIYW